MRFADRGSTVRAALQASGRAKLVRRHGVGFWTASATIHPASR